MPKWSANLRFSPVLGRYVITFLFASALFGCKPSGGPPQGGMPMAEVAVMTITPATLPVRYEYVGQTAGSREVEVRARVTGVLQKRNFKEGGAVTQGQSLFTLDPAPFQASLAAAEADLAGAEARLMQAKRNAARLKPLFEAKAASQKEYDDSTSAEAIAAADLQASEARLQQAKLNLAYTQVASPLSGIAGRALRSEGTYVSGPDVLLTSVTRIDPMYVLFGIPDEVRLKITRELEAGQLVMPADGQFTVSIKLVDGSVYSKIGTLNFSDIRVSGETGASEKRAELPNPDGLLRPGQFVRVTLGGAQRPNAIVVPQRAVLQGPQGRFVYIVDGENKAQIRPVQVGAWQTDEWLIESGLKAGETIIVDGVMKIGPGAPVRIAGAEPTKPAAVPAKP